MAKPIEATPTLEGKNAEEFIKDLSSPILSEEEKAFFKEFLKLEKNERQKFYEKETNDLKQQLANRDKEWVGKIEELKFQASMEYRMTATHGIIVAWLDKIKKEMGVKT